MEIWVEFLDGKWRISPDPAEVKHGMPVLWRFRAEGLGAHRVRWSVHFKKSPFKPQPGSAAGGPFTIATETTQNENGQHTGSSSSTNTDNRPGDYKYDVRAQDAETDETLGNEDPRLIVV